MDADLYVSERLAYILSFRPPPVDSPWQQQLDSAANDFLLRFVFASTYARHIPNNSSVSFPSCASSFLSRSSSYLFPLLSHGGVSKISSR